MKKVKIISLTVIVYITLFVLEIIFAMKDYDKLFAVALVIFLGYSIFNIFFIIKIAYKFLRNKIGYKNKKFIITNQKENIKNEYETTLAKKTFKIGVGCILAPLILIIGYSVFAYTGLLIMGLVGTINSFIPSSWRSCHDVVDFVDPITHRDSTFGKKEGVIYYKYGGGDLSPTGCKILKDADVITFKLLGGDYAKDKNNIYISRIKSYDDDVKILNGVDVASFEYVGNNYAKDKNSVYYYDNILSGADAPTFKILENGYAKDKSNVYYSGRLLMGADSNSFEVMKSYLETTDSVRYNAKDKNNLYLSGRTVGNNENKK